MTTLLDAKRPAYILCLLGLTLACIYLLPYHVPTKAHGVSEAYAFGWNSRAGLITLLAMAGSFAVLTKGLSLKLPPVSTQTSSMGFLPKGLLYATVAFTCTSCLLIWFKVRAHGAIADSAYFLPTYNSAFLGGTLYKTFAFYYGPLMFYPAVWIREAFPGVSSGDAYFAWWTVQFTVGMWVFCSMTQMLLQSRSRAVPIFTLTGLPLLAMLAEAGENYTPLRYILSPFFALLVERGFKKGQNLVRMGAGAAAAGIILLLYSPELGIQFFVATLLFFALCVRPLPDEWPRALLVFCAIMSAGFFAAFEVGEFNLLIKVGTGGINFPLLASFTTLVPILFIFLAACVVVSASRRNEMQHPLLYLILLALASSPAAMGRCDPGHILMNTFGAFLAVVYVLAQYGSSFQWMAATFLAFELLVNKPVLLQFRGLVKRAVVSAGLYHPKATIDSSSVVTKVVSPTAGAQTIRLLALPAGTTLFGPFGGTESLYDPQALPVRLDTGYFPGILPLYPSFVQDKIEELKLRRSELLLLPDGWEQGCDWHGEQTRQFMGTLFMAVYLPHLRHSGMSARPLCDYIMTRYEPSRYASPLPRTEIYSPRSPGRPTGTGHDGKIGTQE